MAQLQNRQGVFHGSHTTLMTATTTMRRAQQTNPYYNPTSSNDNDDHWSMSYGSKVAAAVGPIIGFCILLFGIWYCCCGGRAKRRQRLARRNLPGPHPQPQGHPNQPFQNRAVELTPVPAAHLGDAPPPRYEEVLPPRHQTIAGGVTHVRDEEEGIISDGKTPLSEIPFEDVVVSSASSSGSGSSARNFSMAHHGAGGNTYGHTNT